MEKATVRGFCPRQWPSPYPYELGRSGGAGYTDPNNKNEPEYRNEFSRDRVAARESLVGICK
jgi:hypothetical protein